MNSLNKWKPLNPTNALLVSKTQIFHRKKQLKENLVKKLLRMHVATKKIFL